MSKIFVVTNPENGWDCVFGVYQANSEQELNSWLLKQEGYDKEPDWWEDCRIIHLERLEVIEEDTLVPKII